MSIFLVVLFDVFTVVVVQTRMLFFTVQNCYSGPPLNLATTHDFYVLVGHSNVTISLCVFCLPSNAF